MKIIAGSGFLIFGILWLYWLQSIRTDVNKALPPDQQDPWKWWAWDVSWREAMRQNLKMHWFWGEHARLFPKSPKRIYCSVSIVLAFTIPITCMIVSILIGRPI